MDAVEGVRENLGAPASLQVFATGPGDVVVTDAEAQARVSMRARRHLGPAAEDTFDIITPEASRTFVTRITEQIGAAGPPISLMALIAAMVVVTNTTLVSVTERTREIGVRRAVGARRGNVIVETLAESLLVALVGGAAGLLLAVVALSLPSRFDRRGSVAPVAGVALASLAAAGLSGALSGLYPARRAASLDIVDALKQE